MEMRQLKRIVIIIPILILSVILTACGQKTADGQITTEMQSVMNETTKAEEDFMIETPPFFLHENIRNTANIYSYAMKETELGQDVITDPVEGPVPKSENIADKKKLMQRMNNLLKEYLVDEHLEASSMVILVDDLGFFMDLFPEGIAKWKFVTRPSENESEIRVSMAEDFKGLESDMVIYIHKGDTTANLKYIAYTRAKYYLLELVLK